MIDENENRSASILFTGDLGLTQSIDQHEVFDSSVLSLIKSSDLLCINLELPFTSSETRMAPNTHPSLKSLEDYSSVLMDIHPDVVNIGTNHCLDGGTEGIRLTRETLSKYGIQAIGAGLDEVEARTPAFVLVGDREFSFLSFCKKGNFTADGKRPGAALLSRVNLERDIPDALKRSDNVIVIMHMGMEFSRSVHPMYRELAHLAVDLGASCVIGHHPHVIQGMETYKGAPIFFSLGNFLFDNYAGAVTYKGYWEARHRGILVKITFSDSYVSNEVIPVVSTSKPLSVRLSSGNERTEILDELKELSQGIMDGTNPGSAEAEAFSAIAKREVATIIALTRLHGFRFIYYFIRDLKLRHIRMAFRALWNWATGK